LVAEAEENNLDWKAKSLRWKRWHTCGLCEQDYHGVVRGALGWACWKTYVGRPEGDWDRRDAMTLLGLGLAEAKRHDEALSVREAELSLRRRLGDSEHNILVVQSNLATTYQELGRLEEALLMQRDVYSGRLELSGEENEQTLIAANNCALSLNGLQRFEEAKTLLHETMPVARRVLGENDDVTLKMRKSYAAALYRDPAATLDDLREAVTTLEDAERIARRVLGGAHPLTIKIGRDLRKSRATLRAREDPRAESIRLHMRLLKHASACRDANCPSANCRKMKDLMRHGATCTTRVQGGCAICRRIWALLQIHARQCTRGSCPVPKCASLKAQLAQMQHQGAEGETTTAS